MSEPVCESLYAVPLMRECISVCGPGVIGALTKHPPGHPPRGRDLPTLKGARDGRGEKHNWASHRQNRRHARPAAWVSGTGEVKTKSCTSRSLIREAYKVCALW